MSHRLQRRFDGGAALHLDHGQDRAPASQDVDLTLRRLQAKGEDAPARAPSARRRRRTPKAGLPCAPCRLAPASPKSGRLFWRPAARRAWSRGALEIEGAAVEIALGQAQRLGHLGGGGGRDRDGSGRRRGRGPGPARWRLASSPGPTITTISPLGASRRGSVARVESGPRMQVS